jgi:hypothetical protein
MRGSVTDLHVFSGLLLKFLHVAQSNVPQRLVERAAGCICTTGEIPEVHAWDKENFQVRAAPIHHRTDDYPKLACYYPDLFVTQLPI